MVNRFTKSENETDVPHKLGLIVYTLYITGVIGEMRFIKIIASNAKRNNTNKYTNSYSPRNFGNTFSMLTERFHAYTHQNKILTSLQSLIFISMYSRTCLSGHLY